MSWSHPDPIPAFLTTSQRGKRIHLVLVVGRYHQICPHALPGLLDLGRLWGLLGILHRWLGHIDYSFLLWVMPGH